MSYDQRLGLVRQRQEDFCQTANSIDNTIYEEYHLVCDELEETGRNNSDLRSKLGELTELLREPFNTSGRMLDLLRQESDMRHSLLCKAEDLAEQLQNAVNFIRNGWIPILNGERKNKAENSKTALEEIIEKLKSNPFRTEFNKVENDIKREIQGKLSDKRRLQEGTDRAKEVRETLRELKNVYNTLTGRLWSEAIQEGPILVMDNKVRGSETFPELKDMCKDLLEKNALR